MVRHIDAAKQPSLSWFSEDAIRQAVAKSRLCELRSNSTVSSLQELEDGVIVHYQGIKGDPKQLKCSFLVGADGKRGVIRKRFLEPVAGIKQEVGIARYTGTWVAANLKISLPTPKSHPEYPFWKLGMTPEDVYELYWPKGWHFCSPPGKATASGRFGPLEDRFWRHEFAEPDWNDSKNSVDLLWQHLLPMITKMMNGQKETFLDGKVPYPQDCIAIQRCRPFTFRQLVVNKWFHNRTILIGDAAHVFPPFGGQGIACGIRDGFAASWRLAMLLRTPEITKASINRTLTAWALERRQGVDDSTKLTMEMGRLCNEPDTLGAYLFRKTLTILSHLPCIPSLFPPSREHLGYKPTDGGFFLREYDGGGKLAQIYVQSSDREPRLSDQLLRQGNAVMTLLIVTDEPETEAAKVERVLQASNAKSSIISSESLLFYSLDLQSFGQFPERSNHQSPSRNVLFHQVLKEDLAAIGITTRPGYNPAAFADRLGIGTKYAIVRPDYIFFALAKNLKELEHCVELLNKRLD